MTRFFILCVLFIFLRGKFSAQAFTIAFPPPTCLNQTLTATVISPPPGAVDFSWTVTPPGLVSTVASNQALITFTSCGSQTIICSAYNIVGTLLGVTAFTTSAICPGLTITPVIQTICAGATATLTASGAGSYTWSNSQNGAVINPSPSVATTYTVAGNTNTCFATATVKVINLITSATNLAVCSGFNSTLTAFGSSSYTWTGSSLANPVLQPSVAVGPGAYTVSSAATNNVCTASITIAQLQPIQLTLSVSPIQSTTCINQNYPYKLSKPVNLFAFGASAYAWTPYNPAYVTYSLGPTTTVRPSTSTCYTVTGSTSVCSATAQICVSVKPQFTFDVAQSMQRYAWEGYEPTSSFCRFFNCALSIGNLSPFAAGPSSVFIYNWNFAPTMSVSSLITPTVMFAPLGAFSFTAEVTDAQGCISTPYSATPFVMASCHFGNVGLNSEKNNHEFFEIYPNPAKEEFFIRTRSDVQNFSVEVIDVLGKNVLRDNSLASKAGETYLLNITDLRPDIYFINLVSGGKVIYRSKVLKE